MSKAKLTLLIIVGILALVAVGYTNFLQKRSNVPLTNQNEIQTFPIIDAKKAPRLSTLADNLEIPWALVFLPIRQAQGGTDRSILFTERPGRVRFIDNKSNLIPEPIALIDDVLHAGEGGLMGITIHPDFSNNHFAYVYYTYSENNNATLNRVVRFKFEDNIFSDKTIIVDAIPGAFFHNGGRIKFGPDGFLYITTGDSQNPSLAQDKNSLAGKILRVTEDGKPASGNPFGNEVWSLGHRNPQGITWDALGNLWETEHGQSANDELNLIEKNKNYGWPARLASESVAGRPTIQENQTQSEMVDSILNSGSDTWAPSGAAYLNGSIFFAGLRGQALFEYNIENKKLTAHLKGEIGRIREVVLGHDNLLYITTSNKDGRGVPGSLDDKIIRVNPSKL